MYEVKDAAGQIQNRIPIDEIQVGYEDPSSGARIRTPITQFFMGDFSERAIEAHPFLYDKNRGCIFIRNGEKVGVRELENDEKKLLEEVIKIKRELEADSINTKEKAVDGQHQNNILGFRR